MDLEDFAHAQRLTGSEMNERRQKLKRELIEINLEELPQEFSIEDVVDICEDETALQFDRATVRSVLMEFDGVYVKHTNEDQYEIVETPKNDGFNDVIDPVWREYEKFLQLYKTGGVDPYYTSQIKPAFRGFFKNFLAEITDSVEDLNENQRETIYTEKGETENLASEQARRHGVPDNGIFVDSIKEYLKDPGEQLLSLTDDIYTTAVNKDILSRERDYVNLPEIPKTNRKLVLDTNFLVPLLADTDDLHPLVSSVCNKSGDAGFDLHYTSETANELDSLISGSNDQMRGVYSGTREFNLKNRDNQLISDYNNKPDISWQEYHKQLLGWRHTLEEEYGITEFDVDKQPNEKINKNTKEKLLEGGTEIFNEQALRRLNHDGEMLGIVAEYRQHSDWSFGPFVLTFHQKLAEIGKAMDSDPETKDLVGERPLAFHPRGWLNYLISFSSVEFEDEDRERVSTAILRTASDFDETMNIDEYVHHFAPKVDVGVDEEENLKEILLNHRLSQQLEEAIEEDEGHRAEKISREILEDDEYLQRIEEERDFESRIKKARSRIEELERQMQNADTETNKDGIQTPSESSFRSSYRELYSRFRSSLPADLDATKFSQPPRYNGDLVEIKQWLHSTVATINESEAPEDIEDMKGELENLIAEAIRLTS